MMTEAHGKVQSRHLKRNAYLYIRQSSLRQVLENTESTQRQYALKQRAIALGWTHEQIIVVDTDQGQSGASAAEREGFQKLVSEVGLGRAGIVMGLEVSRLARNCSDWHRLLEICALADTLILDEDGIYDPAHFNDRLLLGLKGTMSEAELHLLKSRLLGGVLSKARRGELQSPLPIGFVYDATGRVVLDPDKQVQQSIRVFFQTFRRTGSAIGTVKAFREQHLTFPRQVRHGPHKGEVIWGVLDHPRALWVLHNPRFAGAFFYGRTRQRKHGDGRYKKLPREEWIALVQEAHAGYISWEDFEENQRRLLENSAIQGSDRRRSPPREGPALLQGAVICGRCGARMTVRYHQYKHRRLPSYLCQREGIQHAEPICQCIPGMGIDQAIGNLLVETVSPMALEVTLAVQQELQARVDEADALRRKQVERSQYEVDLARRRYMRVDPDNRLVADSLEAEWNAKLRALTEAQEQYAREREADRAWIDDEKRARILALAQDFPSLWRDPDTPDRERKRMLRLLIEDVTLTRGKEITAHVRFRGGATRTLTLPPPLPAWKLRQKSPELIAEIDQLLDHHTDKEIAVILNERGVRSGEGNPVHRDMIRRLRLDYGLKSRYDRLREAGLVTRDELANKLGVSAATVRVWRRWGLLRGHAYTDRNDYLYEPPGKNAPAKHKWKRRAGKVVSNRAKEVQCEA
jgi:DNA invertase Pin-like site-specific DNA recombinase